MLSLDYKLLAALSAIIEAQSFDIAAKSLFISQSAISQRIKLLEEKIGQPVMIRSQPIELTLIGEQLLNHYKNIQQLENELLPEILPNNPIKPIKVSLAVNADSIATWFIKALTPFLKVNRVELNLLLVPEDRTLEKLRTGEALGAVSVEEKPLKGFRSVKLGVMKYCLVASKNFYDEYFSEGVTQQSLKMAPAVSYDHKDNMHIHFIEKHFNLPANEYYCHSVGSSEAFVELAKQGVAYCLVPELQIEKELASGDLVKLCPDKQLLISLYWHSWILVKGINKKLSQEIVKTGQIILNIA